MTDALLQQFLLGRVEDEERQRIEILFITDSLIRDRVLAAEQKLIDDYLEDCLSTADRDLFLSRYGDTAAQRRKLRIAKSIQEWAANQPKMPVLTAEPAISVWDRLRAPWRVKPVFVIPIAVMVTIAIVVVFVWVNSRRTEPQGEYLAMQRELVQLNTPSSLREIPSTMSHLTLKPGSSRSVDPEPELKKRTDNSVAELRLLWMQKEDYPSYQVILRRPGDEQSYTIPNLRAEKEDGKFIRVRLPNYRLNPGNYHLELIGIAGEGSKSPPEVYSFTVSE